MASTSNVRIGTVSDPVALRAFASPFRQELYDLVAREGRLTAADAARLLGISHGLASHHLRQLAKYGFIEPADTEQHRARPWRVVNTSLDLRPEEPEGVSTRDALERMTVDRAAAQLAAWQRRDSVERTEWSRAGTSSSLLYLTADEFAELHASLTAQLHRLADRRPIGHADARPAGVTPVSVTLVAVPIPPTATGG